MTCLSHSKYHGWWWLGNARTQNFKSHGIHPGILWSKHQLMHHSTIIHIHFLNQGAVCDPFYGSGCTKLYWNWLSMHLILVDNTSQATFIDMSLYIFRPCLLRPSLFSSARNQKVCDRFDAGHGPLYMAIPCELPTVKDRCNILNAKFL